MLMRNTLFAFVTAVEIKMRLRLSGRWFAVSPVGGAEGGRVCSATSSSSQLQKDPV